MDFGKSLRDEFNEIWVVDLGGDVRENPKLSGTKHNVFGIQTGVAIGFLCKRARSKGCRLFYARRPDMRKAEEKLSFLASESAASDERLRKFDRTLKQNWIGLAETDFESLLPLVDKRKQRRPRRQVETRRFSSFFSGCRNATG